MVVQGSHERNYWHLLAAAREALAAGDFANAERRHDKALQRRGASPGRVFVTERLADGVARLFRRGGPGVPDSGGRWDKRLAEFRGDYLARAEQRVREAVRLAELRPEDNAEANQPILATALFLVARSRLFSPEPESAVALLKGLVRTAHRTGRPFSVDLLRHDLPLTAEDRLWLARKCVAMLDVFLDQGRLTAGTPPAHEWTAAVLRLLQPEYFGQGERLDEERSWLEARSSDRLLGRAEASVSLYREYLRRQPAPAPRSDEARVRLLELQANIDARHFAVPSYDAALGALRTSGLAPGSEAAGRYRTAISCLEYRRPEPAPAEESLAWASAGLAGDGTVAVVFWWGSAPRDLAFWRPGDDASSLDGFLAPCRGRVVAADPATNTAIGQAWSEGPGAWSVREYAEVLAPSAAGGGEGPADPVALGAGENSAWRADWRRDLGLPELAPGEDLAGARRLCNGALQAGLALLALRRRVGAADPAVRAGMGEMARRGDPASRQLYPFLVLEDAAGRAVDDGFAPWTLPVLWARPFPDLDPAGQGALADQGLRPDLARDNLAVVTTGRPAPVLAAWCAGQHRWRVVLDRLDRLPELLPVAAAAGGPVTVVPPGGAVHDLDAALELLTDLLPGGALAGEAGLMPICHWVRLVTTHNGDLLDREMLRPRLLGARPLLDRYAELVADLPRVVPAVDTGAVWAEQFGQRVRRAGCVLGLARDLPASGPDLDAVWGVFDGSGASWIFLDAAAVRGLLGARGELAPAAWHALLHSRGERHLALLTGAVWARNDVEDLLAEEAAVYGPAVAVALTDLRPPPLLLADRGITAGAQVLRGAALAAAVAHLESAAEGDARRVVLPPPAGPLAEFWRQQARKLPGVGDRWSVGESSDAPASGRRGAVLCLPVLPGVAGDDIAAAADTPTAWAEADEVRRMALVAARRRAGVELAAHLAGRWDAVEVLDPAWWHLVRPAGAEAGRGWNGEKAAAFLAPAGCRCFDLPDGSGHPAAAAIAAWVARDREPRSPAPASAEVHGLRLEIGRDETTVRGLLSAVEAAREAGDLDRWLLVVADRAWPPAAQVAAAGRVPGATVWTTGGDPPAPGPVMWVRPSELLEPALQEYLDAFPPAAAVVPDLGGLLPLDNAGPPGAAAALRVLLDRRPPALVLVAASLPAPWTRFLVASAGVDLVAADGAAPVPPGAVERPTPALLQVRLRRLLIRLRPLLEARARAADGRGPRHLVSARELVSLARLGQLTGLAPATVGEGLRVLRWAAALAGENLSTADAAPDSGTMTRAPGHALLIRRRFAECEAGLDELAAHLDLFLAAWCGDLNAGGVTRVDLAAPPASIDAAALRRLDTFLLTVAPGCGLSYRAPRGVLGSTRRLLELSRPAAEMRREVLHGLELFRGRLREVMSSAEETADGFLVETGVASLRREEQDFLSLGAALDEWRWLGPVQADALHVVDLLTLADSATASGRGNAWSLVGDLLGDPDQAAAAADAAPERRAGWRSLLPGNEKSRDARRTAAERVAGLAGLDDDQRFVVLRGLSGTGRLAAVLEGLAAARSRAADPGDVIVCCPDTATAARVARRAAQAGLALDLRLPDREELPPAAPDEAQADAAATDVIVLCEAQRFGAEMRYRVAQSGRGRRLVMTVDPAAADESWENLFLTTPRASNVITLETAAHQSRRLWEETRGLVPPELRPAGASRHDQRGEVVAEYAANLDQCLARLHTAQEEQLLPRRFRLTAPLAEDLAHLGAALRAQGWLAVDEEDCDRLCLPGPAELLVLANGVLAVGGETGDAEAEPAAAAGILARLPGAGEAAAAWLADLDRDPRSTTLVDLYETVAAANVLPVLASPAARARVRDLLSGWGRQTLTELSADGLWAACWRTLRRDLQSGAPAANRPLVLLNPAARAPGATVRGGVYLCLGSEPDRQHYRALAGIRERLLVLYQERSPLPSGAAERD